MKPLLVISFLSFALIWVSPASSDAGGSGGGGFVETDGARFVLNGSPFYANGFNAYWMMVIAADPSQRGRVSSALEEASGRGLVIARTWAFNDGGGWMALQSSPGSYDEQVFQGLDFVVSEARKYGMRLVLSLVNNYDSMGGKKQYVEWARARGQPVSSEDDFFTNDLVKSFYKDHIKTVLTRRNSITGVTYRDDPTIMAWELMNEVRCPSDPSAKTVQSWITEMASYVKSIDRKHLLEAGLEGFYGPSSQKMQQYPLHFQVGTDFIANNQIPDIDFTTVHSYPDQWLSNSNEDEQLSFLNNWIETHITDAQNMLRKPVLFAEFGKSSNGYSPDQRDRIFNAVYSTIYSSASKGGAAAGGMFWQLLTEGLDSFQDGYGIVLSQGSSTVDIISLQSQKLNRIRKMFARRRHVKAGWKH
ncbi:hypothetical protein MLD38_022245 [Melastoma candidum]|uniref:Uncharacterized protein n=1 Tax=Melastoma candidum TaxID=119954 RepID=A0ACB9QHZ2_9MYRT|nr:hypothetical protein MLD38_022245 [Melastoma candidum]